MTGHSITLTRVVHASPVRVWAVLTDLDGAPQVLRGVSRVERMTDGPYAVGTRWRETRKMMGKEGTEELWVVENDPLRRTVIAAESGGTEYRTEFDLRAEGEADTLLRYTFQAETAEPGTVQRVLWKVFGKVGERATAKMMEQDLDDISAAAQRMGG
jgi:carbon monoxide dehydrogenase subunit G